MANKNKLRHKNSKSVLKTGLILISVIGVITFLIISYLIYSLQCYAYDNNISSDYLKTGEKGTGLIVSGKKIIPFDRRISKDSSIYNLCQTDFRRDVT